MSVFTYCVALFIIGAIIAATFHGTVGVALIGVAVIGMFFALLQFVDSHARRLDQDEAERTVDERLTHHPR